MREAGGEWRKAAVWGDVFYMEVARNVLVVQLYIGGHVESGDGDGAAGTVGCRAG